MTYSSSAYAWAGAKRSFCFFLFFASLSFAHAQKVNTDSLKKLLPSVQNDTARLRILFLLVENVYDESEWPPYNEEAYRIALRLTSNADTSLRRIGKKGLGDALNNTGYLYDHKGETKVAIEYYLKSLSMRIGLNDKRGMAESYNNIASLYSSEGNVFKAIDYHQEALKLREEIGDKHGIAESLNNLGYIYKEQGDPLKAMEYYRRSVKIKEQIGDKRGIANTLNNIGLIYLEQHKTDSAMLTFRKSLAIRTAIGHTWGIANSLNNIGLVWLRNEQADSALECFQKSLQIREGLQYKEGIAWCLKYIAEIYLRKGNTDEALASAKKALDVATSAGLTENISNSAELLYKIYKSKNDAVNALQMHELYVRMRDSIYNRETRKATIRNQFKYEYDQKEAVLKANEQRKEELAKKEAEKQKLILDAVIAGLVLMALLSLVIYYNYRNKKRANDIISEQKKEVERQKEIADEKNKEITDSIHYAQRIQRALLASEDLFHSHFKEHFIFYRPKDIVSGDFYWATLRGDDIYLAICDCTGHGVPGAFMSLLNMSFLNEAVNEKNIAAPGKVFDHVRQRLVENISHEGAQDGMDGTLIKLKRDLSLSYSSALSHFLLVRNGELREFSGDKMPVGRSPRENAPFTTHTLQLQPGDLLYFFTDGIADQFGGPKGKKFRERALRDLVLSVSGKPLTEQSVLLDRAFAEWKGELAQVDDVLVIGIRV